MEQRAREGDLIETFEGLIFDVKGMIHPPERFIAYLRYYPNLNGERVRKGICYAKIYSLEDRYEFLKCRFPHYLFYDETLGEMLQGVPTRDVCIIYRPTDLVKQLLKMNDGDLQNQISSLLRKAFELVTLIQFQSGIKFDNIGITGSSLVNLETTRSDIDLIIYGSKNAYLVKNALIELYKNNQEIIQPYSKDNIANLYEFRGKNSGISFQDFEKIEQRKKLQGIFKGTDYYIRCIKSWNEIQYKYGEIYHEPLGIATVRGIISDEEEGIFTPCKYLIESSKIINGVELRDPILEIVSFRGRFCEQARKGEEIEARGKIELVKYGKEKYLRLLLGTYKEDYFKILNL